LAVTDTALGKSESLDSQGAATSDPSYL
jgi:hypothetical protein